MFNGCSSLTSIPQLDTSNVTDISYMFFNCSSLTSIPQLDTSNVTDMSYMFNGCSSLTSIPQLDTSNVTSTGYMFDNCTALENLGGLVGLKVNLSLSSPTKLTHDSLMNVINNLYDLTGNGLSGKTLTLGSTNLGKLTADEIAIATNKGWTLK
jgi:surface protein